MKLAVRVYQINLQCQFTRASLRQADGGESCIVVESEPTCSLVAKVLQNSLLAMCEFRVWGGSWGECTMRTLQYCQTI